MSSGKYQFQKLTPTTKSDIGVYIDAIDFAFKNQDIHNVAISGAYSAGKSSLLESYKARHKERKFLHISLAHFIPAEDEEMITDGENEVKESVLEGKILNQLLHQIPEKKIPQTNFRVKKGIGRKEIVLEVAFLLIWFLCVLRVACSQKLENFTLSLPENHIRAAFELLAHPYCTIVATGIFLGCTTYLAYTAMKLQKNKAIFKKININGNEIEIFEKQDESYFDKYLNEVLYLFENSGADVIVFEDMDRFNSSQIFERLHEVNTLVNTRRKSASEDNKERYEPIRFFYLLRDDMFVTKDRTKFFDFIIPVVPVIDGSNSYDKFIEIFREAGYLDKFDASFLQSLSLYVDDMRILKNICNEFIVYINRINTIELDWNKMLALIAYKNIFPRDFSELQLGKGFVRELFDRKNDLVQERIKTLNAFRTELKNNIVSLKTETLITEKEFEDVGQAEKARYNQTWGHTAEQQNSHTKYQEELSKRKEAFLRLKDASLDELSEELEKIAGEIQHVKTASLKELITKENIEKVFSATYTNEIKQVREFREIKSSDYFNLLKFLIRNGYIDETYSDYMSYFYEDSLSAGDKKFLRRITDQRGAEYAYPLKAPEKVAESSVLRNVEFEREEILNFDLLSYLLGHLDQSRYTTFVNTLIVQLRDTKRFNFIIQFYGLNRTRKQFVIELNKQWDDFFHTALHETVFTAEQIKQYSIETLYYSEPDVILSVDVDSCLSQYISQTSEYIAIEQPDSKKLAERFALLGVSIENLTDRNVDTVLLDEIYQRNLYALNAGNIVFWLRKRYGVQDDSTIWHQNFTIIIGHQKEPLYKYVMENLPMYTTVMLSSFSDEICDAEAAAVCFLNQESVIIEQKKCYIEHLNTKITDLSEIKDYDLWGALLDSGKLEFSIENLLYFFIKFGLERVLVEYVNQLPENCDFSGIKDAFEESARKKLYASIVRNNDIQNEKYRMILLGLGFPFQEYSADGISSDKFSILIQSDILQMNEQTLSFVRNSYPQHLLDFVEHNLDEYIKINSTGCAEVDEVVGMLTRNISDEKKLELLALTNEPVSVEGKSYSDQITAYILEHNYHSNDFDNLCQNYSQYGEQSKICIVKKASENCDDIYRYDIVLDDLLLSELLPSQQVDRQYKIAFFVNGIPSMTEETCKKHFCELQLPKLCHILDAHGGYNYDQTNEISTIFEGLKRNGWIYDYHTDKRSPQNRKYVVTKNPPKSK